MKFSDFQTEKRSKEWGKASSIREVGGHPFKVQKQNHRHSAHIRVLPFPKESKIRKEAKKRRPLKR